MGRRNQLPKYQVFTNADTTTNPESVATDVGGVDSITYEIGIDNTVDASLDVQFCNDDKINDSSVFKSLDFTQPTPLDGAANTEGMVHIQNLGFRWLKLVVADNGGSGSVNAWISGVSKGA